MVICIDVDSVLAYSPDLVMERFDLSWRQKWDRTGWMYARVIEDLISHPLRSDRSTSDVLALTFPTPALNAWSMINPFVVPFFFLIRSWKSSKVGCERIGSKPSWLTGGFEFTGAATSRRRPRRRPDVSKHFEEPGAVTYHRGMRAALARCLQTRAEAVAPARYGQLGADSVCLR